MLQLRLVLRMNASLSAGCGPPAAGSLNVRGIRPRSDYTPYEMDVVAGKDGVSRAITNRKLAFVVAKTNQEKLPLDIQVFLQVAGEQATSWKMSSLQYQWPLGYSCYPSLGSIRRCQWTC